jgi:predicted nuclease with TOPRIM domain
MNELTHLTFLRKHYSELLKLFFLETQKGTPLSELTELQSQIDAAREEIQALEKELNIQPKE